MSALQTLLQHFEQLGLIRWPMLVAALFLVAQIVRAYAVRHRPPSRHRTVTRHAILAWGLFNALLGVLGTAAGLIMTARSVEHAGSVDPALLGAGLRIALTPGVAGCSLLALGVLAWLVLPRLGSGSVAGQGEATSLT